MPKIKGKSIYKVEKVLSENGFYKANPSNQKNNNWNHPDGSQVLVHKYGNKCPCGYKSGNNAHIHKKDASGRNLSDRGIISGNPNETHIGIKNPADFPIVAGRPHGV